MKATISERLKTIMVKNGWRQIDILERCRPLGEKYGVEIRKGDLSQYVSGKVRPNSKRLFILSQALGVSEQYLLGYDDLCDESWKKFNLLSIEDRKEIMALIDRKLEKY